MMTVTPAHEPEKPVPTLAVVRPSEPQPERKLSDWSVADLVRDDPAPNTPKA